MSFYGLAYCYQPIMRRVQNTYWPAKDQGKTTCKVSLQGLVSRPLKLDEAQKVISKFLQVHATILSYENYSIQLDWKHDFHKSN